MIVIDRIAKPIEAAPSMPKAKPAPITIQAANHPKQRALK